MNKFHHSMTTTVNTILAFQSYAVFCLLAMVAMLLLWQNYLNIFILRCTLFSFCALFPNSICSLPQVTQCCEKITCYFQNREVQSTTVKVSKTFFYFWFFSISSIWRPYWSLTLWFSVKVLICVFLTECLYLMFTNNL